MKCPEFLKHVLTEPDNKTFCPVRIIGISGCVVFLGLAIAHYVQHSIFDPQAFSLGFGAMLTGLGAALNLKKDSPIGPQQ